MAVAVKCPKCSKPLPIHLKHVTWTIKCRHCSHQFIPVEDAGIPCPECGVLTIMLREDAFKELTCLDCGHNFRGRGFYFPRRLILIILALLIAFILLAVIVPGLIERPNYANEASAISALRTLSSAEELFNCRFGRYATLGQLAGTGMIDPVLARATSPWSTKSGYYFTLTVGGNGWSCLAMPAEPGKTGTRSFFIDTSGVIYFAPCKSENDLPAGPGNGSPLGG